MKLRFIIFAILSVLVSTANAQLPIVNCANPGSVIVAAAPWYCNQINQGVADQWAQWEPLAAIAVIFAFMTAILIFLIGVIAKNDRLRIYGIGEMYEAIATAMIIFMFLTMSAVLFGILPALATGTIDPYDVSLSYIAQVINSTTALSTSIFRSAVTAAYHASFQLTVCPDVECINALGILRTFIYFFFFWPSWSIITFMFDAQFSLFIQYYLILFFLYASIPVFLIPGAILRAFIPTRHVGGMMMAVAIGFYFIMPVLFSIAYYFTTNSLTGQAGTALNNINRYTAGTGTATAGAITPNSPLVSQIKNVQHTFSDFWLSIVFFPSLIIALTYAFVIQIAEFIGGMAKTSSRLRSLL